MANCKIRLRGNSLAIFATFLAALYFAPFVNAQDFVTESSARAELRIANEQMEYAKTLPPGSDAYVESLQRAVRALSSESLLVHARANEQFSYEVRNASELFADLVSAEVPAGTELPEVTEERGTARVAQTAPATQATEAQVTKPKTAPEKNSASHSEKSNRPTLGIWRDLGILLVLVVMWIVSSKLQTAGRLIVFYDYTDLTLTMLGPFFGLVAKWISAKIGLVGNAPNLVMIFTWSVLWLLPLVVAISVNRPKYLPLVIPTKFTAQIMFVFLYIGAFILNTVLHSSGKGQNEHHMTYKARRRRLEKQESAAWSEKASMIAGWASTYIQHSYFLPFADYVKPRAES